jgi:hypothetical protein
LSAGALLAYSTRAISVYFIPGNLMTACGFNYGLGANYKLFIGASRPPSHKTILPLF